MATASAQSPNGISFTRVSLRPNSLPTAESHIRRKVSHGLCPSITMINAKAEAATSVARPKRAPGAAQRREAGCVQGGRSQLDACSKLVMPCLPS